jgi:hypothetical protein
MGTMAQGEPHLFRHAAEIKAIREILAHEQSAIRNKGRLGPACHSARA